MQRLWHLVDAEGFIDEAALGIPMSHLIDGGLPRVWLTV